MTRARLRANQILDADVLTEAEHLALVHQNLTTSGILNFQDGTISGTGNIYATTYYGNGSQLTGISGGVSSTPASLYYNDTDIKITAISDGFTLSANSETVDFIHDGSNFSIKQKKHGAAFYLMSENNSGVEKYLYTADPDGAAAMYYAGSKAVETVSTGGIKISEIGGGSATSTYHISGGYPTIQSSNDAIPIVIKGTTKNAIYALPSGATTIYYAGDSAMHTRSLGISIGAAYPATDLYNSNGYFKIENPQPGAYIELLARNVGDTATNTLIKADPDEAVELYYNGVKTFETAAYGINVYDNNADDPYIYFKDNLGNNLALYGYSSGAAYILVNGAADNAIVATDGGPVDLYHNGVKVFGTTSNGDGGVRVYDETDNNRSSYLYWDQISGRSTFTIYNGSLNTEVTDFSMFVQNSGGTAQCAMKAFGGGSVELYYAGKRVFTAGAGGIAVFDDNNDDPAVAFYSDVPTLGGYIRLNNIASNPVMTILDASANICFGVDLDAATTLYYNGTLNLETTGLGIQIGDGTNKSVLAWTGSYTTLRSKVHGGDLHLEGEDSGGTTRQFIACNSEGSVDIYYNDAKIVETTSDGIQAGVSTFNLRTSNGEIGLNYATNGGVFLYYNNDIRFAASSPNNISYVTLQPGTDDLYDLGAIGAHWDDIYATNSVIQTSDERIKTTISGSDLGLDFINELNPVSFKFKDYDYEYEVPTISGSETVSGTKTFHRRHYGLIAQDVQTTLSGLGKSTEDFAGFIYDEEADVYGLRLGEFIAPIIKAIQELSITISGLESRIEALEQQ